MINFRFKSTYFFSVLMMLLLVISCANKKQEKLAKNSVANDTILAITKQPIRVGADRILAYIPLIKGKKIGIVANQTSVINIAIDPKTMGNKTVQYHLVDYLNDNHNIQIQKVFSPEHGFRGKADAGEIIADGKDIKTGLPIISLYGKNKKPTPAQLKDIEVVVFDIQDVGARFYTYISTLHYIMEACAEANIPVIVLDRPNPNGHYIDGPILEIEHTSFVGMHPIPVVYGMTIGEYAQMINEENWLKNSVKCDLTVISLENYTHKSEYSLPIKPSPNLPNDTSINLYASLCFFEGTNVSVGRGTEKQFQIFGSPFLKNSTYDYRFIPKPNEGAKHPKHEGKECVGMDLSKLKKHTAINLEYLIDAYNATENKTIFFNPFFTKLAGTKKLQQQIEQGFSAKEIQKTWKKDIEGFKKIRQKYLLYD